MRNVRNWFTLRHLMVLHLKQSRQWTRSLSELLPYFYLRRVIIFASPPGISDPNSFAILLHLFDGLLLLLLLFGNLPLLVAAQKLVLSGRFSVSFWPDLLQKDIQGGISKDHPIALSLVDVELAFRFLEFSLKCCCFVVFLLINDDPLFRNAILLKDFGDGVTGNLCFRQ